MLLLLSPLLYWLCFLTFSTLFFHFSCCKALFRIILNGLPDAVSYSWSTFIWTCTLIFQCYTYWLCWNSILLSRQFFFCWCLLKFLTFYAVFEQIINFYLYGTGTQKPFLGGEEVNTSQHASTTCLSKV